MALAQTLSELAGTGPAPRSRVSILLDRLHAENLTDYETLLKALANKAISGATLTKALRAEYGQGIVTDSSVGDFRRTHTAELTGL